MRSSRNAAAAVVVAFAAVGATLTTSAAADARRGADYFTNVELTTHEGRTVRFYDDLLKGKIVAIDLIYTTCQYACPLETARLAQVQRLLGDRMGRDVFFYSITIDPEHDTPPVLAEYAAKYRAGPGWLFLTGAKADIDRLSKKLGLYSPPDPSNPDGHQPYLLVGNEATGQWMRNAATDNAKFLARTIGEWLTEWQGPEEGRLKSYAEPPVLVHDPGQYAFAYHCAACHTIGGGTKIGPDLAGVTSRRDREWLQHFIRTPGAMNAAGDPIAVALRKEYREARMPNLDLSEVEAFAHRDHSYALGFQGFHCFQNVDGVSAQAVDGSHYNRVSLPGVGVESLEALPLQCLGSTAGSLIGEPLAYNEALADGVALGLGGLVVGADSDVSDGGGHG